MPHTMLLLHCLEDIQNNGSSVTKPWFQNDLNENALYGLKLASGKKNYFQLLSSSCNLN
jgi:hypothetical protein